MVLMFNLFLHQIEISDIILLEWGISCIGNCVLLGAARLNARAAFSFYPGIKKRGVLPRSFIITGIRHRCRNYQ